MPQIDMHRNIGVIVYKTIVNERTSILLSHTTSGLCLFTLCWQLLFESALKRHRNDDTICEAYMDIYVSSNSTPAMYSKSTYF